MREYGLLLLVCLMNRTVITSLLQSIHGIPCSFYLSLLKDLFLVTSCNAVRKPKQPCGEAHVERSQGPSHQPLSCQKGGSSTLPVLSKPQLNHHSWCCRSEQELYFESPAQTFRSTSNINDHCGFKNLNIEVVF